LPLSRIQEVLAAWRQAERDLEVAADPVAIEDLRARIAHLRDEYLTSTAETAGSGDVADRDREPA
jgi:hypothetical protein